LHHSPAEVNQLVEARGGCRLLYAVEEDTVLVLVVNLRSRQDAPRVGHYLFESRGVIGEIERPALIRSRKSVAISGF
jgi:hypothetical protein